MSQRLYSISASAGSVAVRIKLFTLGIHVLCGFAFSALYRVIVQPHLMPADAAGIAREFTELWFEGNFALWGLSIPFSVRLLTVSRAAIAIPLVNAIVFAVLMPFFT